MSITVTIVEPAIEKPADPKIKWSPFFAVDSNGCHRYSGFYVGTTAGETYVASDEGVDGTYYLSIHRAKGDDWEELWSDSQGDDATHERNVESVKRNLHAFLRRKAVKS